MKILENLKYTKDHEWVRVEDEQAYIGITDFAQHELGDIVFVDVTSEGSTLDKEEVFGSIEAVKAVSDIYMPVSGEVLEFNEKLETEPVLINTDPYGEGWIIRVKLSNPDEVNDLLDVVQYKQLLGV